MYLTFKMHLFLTYELYFYLLDYCKGLSTNDITLGKGGGGS